MGTWESRTHIVNEGLTAATRSIRTTPSAKYDADGNHVPMSFVEYVDYVNPRFRWHRHNIELAHVLQDVAEGRYGQHARLIIAMPPRHGKTEEVSKLFSSYWLYRWPREWVALATYVAELSYGISREAMNYYVASCGDAAEEVLPVAGEVLASEAARHWRTTQGGGLWATGIGGPATGKGFNLGIIDDPVKNPEESQSETIGRRNNEWYQSVWYTRETPDDEHSAIIIMHTRWPGPGDLIGWVLEQETADGATEEEAEHWHCVLLPAIKEQTDDDIRRELPPTVTLHPDWRLRMGEALCPERYNEQRLGKIRRRVGEYFWASVFQQLPRPREGGAFKAAWFRIATGPLRPGGVDIRYWDLGASEKGAVGANATVGVRMRVHGPSDITIVDVARFFKTPRARDAAIRAVAELDGEHVIQWGPQDPAAAGKAEAWHFRDNLEGFPVHTELVGGDLETLAGPYASALEGGAIRLQRGAWNKDFIAEHTAAWTGAMDDQIWAAAKCYLKCVRRRKPTRRDAAFGSHSFVTLGA